ncbi:MAG: bacteriorhodopsin-like [Candidatus Caenarcaniphilales bacterium]|nr:bacteriorhodopsin-like [Candidatus Caenarcaniphilales bacterium]
MDAGFVLKSGDYVGFTFFIGAMAMLAASVFFFFERQRVDERWKLSLLVSGLITFIAFVHYQYMKEVWALTQTSPTEFRYIDWSLTVPLMCAEFFLLLKPAGAKVELLWKLILASVVMLVAGYIGESYLLLPGVDRAAIDPSYTGPYSILWGTISTLGWAYIIYEIFFGDARRLAESTDNPKVKAAFVLMRNFVFIGWAIYPIGYMFMPGNLLNLTNSVGDSVSSLINIIYNIGDAVNKVGFGLVIWSMAIADSGKA